MEFVLISIFIFVFVPGIRSNASIPLTTIRQGQLSGKVIISENAREIACFQGIPYAKPPSNELRFKLPVPAEKWKGVFRADTNKVISCPQMNSNNIFKGTEDCLVLNVYTPLQYFRNTSKLPVLIFIHGGGFIRESGMDQIYSPARLLDKDLVLVTLNYRLGVLGFLSSGDEVIPGNFGLFDQTEAMKWVQENIVAFGGDPQKVTIFGQSSGAISVSLHLVSPRSQYLFQGAILQSGTYFGLRAISDNPRKWAKRLAMKLKCPSATMQQLLACLQTKSAEELVAAPNYFYLVNQIPKIFSPSVENRLDGFLPTDPRHPNTKISNVPVMIGITNEEGNNYYTTLEKYFLHQGQSFVHQDLPDIFQGLYDSTGNIHNLAQKIGKFYFGNIPNADSNSYKTASIKMYSDLYSDVGTEQFIKLLTKTNTTTYTFQLSYLEDECNKFDNCANSQNRTPTVDDDLRFVFPVVNLTETEAIFSGKILDLWFNFIAFQNPTPDPYSVFHWIPTSNTAPQYLDLAFNPVVVTKHFTDNVDIWTEATKAQDNCT